MARKRMFDNEIIDQDDFIDLPKEAIALYFLLGMKADDEGFVTPKKILRMYQISAENLKILSDKGLIIPFESGVVVITDFLRNNYLDKNRITPTIYIEERKKIIFDEKTRLYYANSSNAVGSSVKQMLNESSTSIEEYSIEEKSIEYCSSKKEQQKNNAEIIKCYEENIGLITPATAEILFSYLDELDSSLIILAIKKASINGVRKCNYIRGILNDWIKKGYKTELDVENGESNFNQNQEDAEKEKERIINYIKEHENDD